MPKISVIVPVYRVEAYLSRCLDSILRQSFQDFELILVDDGSPDRCPEICEAYAQRDRRIHVLHQENRGLSAARNTGIDWALSHSDSRYIAFADSDDWLHRDYLRILYDGITAHGAGVSVCGRARVSAWAPDAPTGAVEFRLLDMDTAISEHYSGCNPAYCKLIAKELLREIRFPEGRIYEDVFIIYRILLAAGKIAVCDAPLYFYFQNPEGITRSPWTPKRLDQIDAHTQRLNFLRSNGYRKAYERCMEAFAVALSEQLHMLESQGRMPASYKRHYRQIKRTYRSALREASRLGRLPLNDENWGLYVQAGCPRPVLKLLLLMKMY